MAIYLKVDGATGNVTTKGYEQWIDCQELEFAGISTTIEQTIGDDMDRVVQYPHFSLIQLTKHLDSSSIFFFEHAHNRQSLSSVDIHSVRVSDPVFTFSKIRLTNVIVAHYSEFMSAGHTAKPTEQIALSYTAIEKTYIPQESNGTTGSPITSGYDLATGKGL